MCAEYAVAPALTTQNPLVGPESMRTPRSASLEKTEANHQKSARWSRRLGVQYL